MSIQAGMLLALVALASGGLAFSHAAPQNIGDLYVSSDIFDGAMILEIIVRDESMRDAGSAEPAITFDGVPLRMVQGTDGYWYAYVVNTVFARVADEATKIPGTGMDFGIECNGAGFAGAFDPGTVVFTSGITCDDVTDPGYLNVLNWPRAPMPGEGNIGGINLSDADHWPFIQGMEFAESDIVIEYGEQSASVSYINDIDRYSSLSLDRESYPPDTDVHITIRDAQLNMDPTAPDSWTFEAHGDEAEVYWYLFDVNGNLVKTRTDIVVDPAQTYHYGAVMAGIGFGDDNLFTASSLEPGTGAIRVVDNYFQDSAQVPAVTGPAVTIRETGANTGIFTNTDRHNMANLRTASEASEPLGFEVSYYESQNRIVGMVSDGDDAQSQKVRVHEPSVLDAKGGQVSPVQPDQQVLIASDIKNLSGQEQDFAYIVSIKDGNDITVHLSWVSGSLVVDQSLSPAQSWTPDSPGEYQVSVFLWESVNNPVALSPAKSVAVSVG